MFKSADHAVNFMETIIFYNRYCGEFVVTGFFNIQVIWSFFF
jgi:hypothetical protein